ncbi:hypothetical protein T492DRAFT_915524 [Pavlovales sp. CCMP2436]|nr:hypothetical protein T492DRAFT_915524 [Pavlovales sp. CCMP2436]
MYMVQQGELKEEVFSPSFKLYSKAEGNEDAPLNIYSPGCLCIFVDDRLREATVTATSFCSLFAFSKKDLDELLPFYPDVQEDLRAEAAAKIERLDTVLGVSQVASSANRFARKMLGGSFRRLGSGPAALSSDSLSLTEGAESPVLSAPTAPSVSDAQPGLKELSDLTKPLATVHSLAGLSPREGTHPLSPAGVGEELAASGAQRHSRLSRAELDKSRLSRGSRAAHADPAADGDGPAAAEGLAARPVGGAEGNGHASEGSEGGEDGGAEGSGEESGSEGEGEGEGEEAEDEPRLKYQRLGASVAELVKTDTARCLAVHTRFLVLGTGSGLLVVLDFNGNEVRRFTPHSGVVNDICVDAAGEYLGSCSEDGTVVVQSLYDPAEASTHWYHSPVKAMALAPDFSSSRRVFACGGLSGQLMLNTRGWLGAKDEVLHAGEGPVIAIKWHGQLLAWANDAGVKVYDCTAQQRISYIDRPAHSPRADALRPQLVWASASCLLVGWADTIKVGVVRTRPAPVSPVAAAVGGVQIALPVGVTGTAQPVRYIEIVSLIRTEGYICGLAPVRLPAAARDAQPAPGSGGKARAVGGGSGGAASASLLLAVLVYSCEANDELGFASGACADGHAERPELRLLSTDSEEVSSDALSLRGFDKHRAAAYAVVQQPPPLNGGAGALGGRVGDASRPGWRGPSAGGTAEGAEAGEADAPSEPLFYVLSPLDLIVVRARNAHDHLRYLIERGQFEAAVDFARAARGRLLTVQHRQEAAELYLAHLLAGARYAKAAAAMGELLGSDSALWSKWLAAFAQAGRLREAVGAIPTSPPLQLEQAVYEWALLHTLATVRASLGPLQRLVLLWPVSLYRAAEVLLPALLKELGKRTGLGGGGGGGGSAGALVGGAAAVEADVAAAAAAAVAAAAERGASVQPAERALAALSAALAQLYTRVGRLEAALRLWLALRSPSVLRFVAEHSLVGAVRQDVRLLVQLDAEGALELYAAHQHAAPVVEVMAQLRGEQQLQHRYLHALFLKDVHAGAAFAELQVRLYAQFAKALLLPFLRASGAYPLAPTLRTCEAAGLVRERVFILSRMGNSRAALELLLGELCDMKAALSFVREQAEPELSAELLSRSLTSPQLVADLLDNWAGHTDVLQPTELLRRLPAGSTIPGLRAKITRILADYRRQQQLAASCAQISAQDARELSLELFRARQGAMRVQPPSSPCDDR